MIGRTEFADGKIHILKDTAGIILLGNDALLIGNTIFGCANEVLSRANYSYHRENTKAYKQKSFSALIAKTSAEIRCNDLGNISATAARAASRTAYFLIDSR